MHPSPRLLLPLQLLKLRVDSLERGVVLDLFRCFVGSTQPVRGVADLSTLNEDLRHEFARNGVTKAAKILSRRSPEPIGNARGHGETGVGGI